MKSILPVAAGLLFVLLASPATAVLVGTAYQRLEPGDVLEAESVTLGCFEPYNTGNNPVLGVGDRATNTEQASTSASGGAYVEVTVSGLGTCRMDYHVNTPGGVLDTIRLRSHEGVRWTVQVYVDGEYHGWLNTVVGTSWSTYSLELRDLEEVRQGGNLVQLYFSSLAYYDCPPEDVCSLDVDYVGTDFQARTAGGHSTCDNLAPDDASCDAANDVVGDVQETDCRDVFSPTFCTTVEGAVGTAAETADWAVTAAMQELESARTTAHQTCLLVFSPAVCAPLSP